MGEAKAAKLILAALAVVVGLGFVMNTRLIPTLPEMLHWVLGVAFLASGGYIAYKHSNI